MSIEEARRRIESSKETDLKFLDLAGLKLTDEDLTGIFRDNEDFVSTLQYLYLHDNQINNVPFSELRNLDTLSVSNNELKLIPSEISHLEKLKYLFIDEIQFKNSVETILKQRSSLKVYLLDGKDYIAVPFKIFSIFDELSLIKTEQAVAELEETFKAASMDLESLRKEVANLEKRKKVKDELLDYRLNEAKRINQEITELEKSIKLNDEANKHLNIIADRVKSASEIIVSIAFFYLLYNQYLNDFLSNWSSLEAYKELISVSLFIVFFILSRVVKKSFLKWLDDFFKVGFERAVYLLAGFKFNRFQQFKSDYDKLHSELIKVNNKLKSYSEVKTIPTK